MTAPAGSRLDGAIAAFADWQASACSPREAIARRVQREFAPEVRAEIAAVVHGAIRDQRRLAWALGLEDRDLRGMERAAALVLGQCVATDLLTPAAAAQRFARHSAVACAFEAVREFDERLAAVVDEELRFAMLHSLPDWLARLLRAEFGADAATVVRALGTAPPRAIRANRLRIADRGALAVALAEAGVSTAFTAFARDGLVVGDTSPLFELAAYRGGAFEQQDEGSQLVAELVAPPPRGRVLDACAGAGGKTLALAAALGGAGVVLAADVHERRIEELRQRARRAGAGNVRALVVPEDAWPAEVATFAATADRILLDVPCSGIGSWRRRPEARWQLVPADLEALLAVQARLLDRAAASLRPGARIVYATCSLLRGENEGQVEAALARHPGLELVRPAEVLGGERAGPIVDATGRYLALRPDRHGTDGFFAAILRRPRAR